MFAPGLLGGVSPAVCDFQGSSTGGSGTTISFAAAPFGTAAANRYIVVAVVSANGNNALSSATIGGIAATIIAQVAGNNCRAALIIAAVPTGATGTVALTFASSNDRVSVAVYRLTNISSPTARDSATTHDTDPLLTNTLDILSGGAAIGVAVIVNNANSVTWTGLTRDVNAQSGANGWFSAAHDVFAAATTDLTVRADQASDSRSAMVVASWR